MNGRHHLVTGGAGFIGSHLVEHLLATGERVTVLDDLSTGRRENLAPFELNPAFELVVGSVIDRSLIESLVASSEVVHHLAGLVGVETILSRPLDGLERNLRGTWEILEVAARSGARVMFASSSEVYGHAESPLFEDQPLQIGSTHKSRWSYGVSKMAAEHLALAYSREQCLPVTVVRLFNAIGPRQRRDLGMVVPRLTHQALVGEPLTVYGSGSQKRCFCDVRDLVKGWIALSESRASGTVVNLGSDLPITIRELAERILVMAGRSEEPVSTTLRFVPYEEALPAGYEDVLLRVPDLARVKALTGWQAETPLDDSLRDVLHSLSSE